MEITVRLSSGLAGVVGRPRFSVDLEQGATVAHLLDQLRRDYPALSERLNGTVAVVSGKTVDPSVTLSAGQEVAILTPISGG